MIIIKITANMKCLRINAEAGKVSRGVVGMRAAWSRTDG